MTKKEQIITKAIEILKENPDGLRYSELVKRVKASFTDIPINTIHGTVWNLEVREPSKVYKPARGLFKILTEGSGTPTQQVKVTTKIKEEDFYESA
jgi:hypothetical protein